MKTTHCLLLACLTSSLAIAADDEVKPLQAKAPKTTENIRVDGFLQEAIWEQATTVPVHFADKHPGVPQEGAEMTMKVVWDDYFMYIGYEVKDKDIQAASDGVVQGPEGNQRSGVLAHPNKPNDFVEFFISYNDPNFFWEIHHDADNNFNDVWCTVPDKTWPVHGSSMHKYGIIFGFRDIIEDDETYTFTSAVWTRFGEKRRAGTVNDASDEDIGWSAEIRLPLASIATPRKLRTSIKPDKGSHFSIPGPWKMEGTTVNLLAVLHRGELPERYYHSSPTRKGNWFHFTFKDYPVFTFTGVPETAPAE